MYAVIEQLEKEDAVSLSCQILGVSRSAYYAWRQDGCSMRQREDNRLKPLIRSIFWENKRRYGARRIAVDSTQERSTEACFTAPAWNKA